MLGHVVAQVVDQGQALQAGRSRVRFPMVSLGFFIDVKSFQLTRFYVVRTLPVLFLCFLLQNCYAECVISCIDIDETSSRLGCYCHM